jgi:predicted TIM-barrel fold metal-dependent hydrolase
MVALQKQARAAHTAQYEFSDTHIHFTNYVQEGPDIRDLLKMMGTTIKRSTLFGLPLQQHWSYAETGDFAPTYYMQADAPLYYYSFTDAFVAMAYKSLTPEEQARFDPMITGFNPADMYGVEHIRRVLKTFPGVFCGIGEFSVYKEFVSSKIAGEKATLGNPALGRILDFAGEVGMVAMIHTDIDKPFPKSGQPAFLGRQTRELFERHPKTKIIWAHIGLGRVVKPVENQAELIVRALTDPKLDHVYFDISWDETAKYAVESPESVKRVTTAINDHPHRFLFGTDCVAPSKSQQMTDVFHKYDPIWKHLTPEASRMVRLENHDRLFDQAKKDTRAWERANLQ